MYTISKNFGQASYTLSNTYLKVYVTIVGGHLTADFYNGKNIFSPFFYPPWWNEANEFPENLQQVLRGNFFCFPAGLNQQFKGITPPAHGHTANNCWEFKAIHTNDAEQTLILTTEIESENANVTKHVTIKNGQPVIYTMDTICGASGKYPVGYHPTLQLPTTIGSAIMDTSESLEVWTSPIHIESHSNSGYSGLRPNYKIDDLKRVPTVYNEIVDLTRPPFTKGFDDIYMHICDPSKQFCYAAVTVPENGYLYFQIKNPKNLSNTMVWTSNCGRYYQPWNGRVNGVMSINEMTSYFYYGITSAQEDNFLDKKGYRTHDLLDGSPASYKMICGVVPVQKDYTGVKDIVQSGTENIIIKGKNGYDITVPCNIEFLN
jgi:hypothetical protein